MGGSKNKSPAQKERSQKSDADPKKTKKTKKLENDDASKSKPTVIIDEAKAIKYFKESKVITVHDLARQTNVKISVANSYLKKSLKDGTVKRIGGFSGHHIYQSITQK